MGKSDSKPLKDLLENPGTAAFSRVKYLQRFGDDGQIEEFVNGLFLEAVEGRYRGQWDQLDEFLERWDEIGIGLQFQGLAVSEADEIPWARLTKPLSESTLALVTTGGLFVEGQNSFERGDATYRRIPRDAPASAFRIWHPGYDTGPATQDVNCIFPIDRFRELEREGTIGGLAETAPAAARQLKRAGVDAVFLAST